MCASADATYLFMKMHAFLSFSCNFEMVKIKEKKEACSNPFHEKVGGKLTGENIHIIHFGAIHIKQILNNQQIFPNDGVAL